MLTAAPKTRRRRRRRQKRLVQANSTTEINNGDVDDDESVDDIIENNDKNRHYSPRVNANFINEDVEIETAMLLKHLTKDTECALKKDRAIEFFTSSISSVRERIQSKTVDQIEIIPSPDANEENYQERPQLALSYLNDELELETVVMPFDRHVTHSFDVQLIYLPELSMPKQIPSDIESGKVMVERNFVDEGHFVKPKPNILGINRALFINRLIEEGALNWYDFNRKEIKNLYDITLSHRLIKTFCAEKFHPIDYMPTSVLLEYDAFGDRILKIHLKHIYFDVHPTFNSEQQLAREIESLYDEYVAMKQSNILTRIEAKLKILRQILETVSKSNKSKSQQQLTMDSLQMHRNELMELRATWHKESARYRELMKTILEKWAELKKMREGVEPTTSLKLKIKVQESDLQQDEIEWSERFGLEHSEMMTEAMETYKRNKTLRKKKEKRRSKADINNTKDEDQEDAPIEIAKPNSKKIEQNLLDIFVNSMRPPGEKIVDFELESSNMATIKSPPKYYVRLVLDNGQLDFPDSSKLNGVGQAHFNAIFSIKFTTKIPNKLKFQVSCMFLRFVIFFFRIRNFSV